MNEELIARIDAMCAAYPVDIFPVISDEDRLEHGLVVSLASAQMARHICAGILSDCRAALAAPSAQVPREPTEAMIDAGFYEWVDASAYKTNTTPRPEGVVIEVWRAMYDAAQPPSAPAEPLSGIPRHQRATSTEGAMTLLPCPFCGGDAEFERMGDYRQSCQVRCTNCGCSHESPDEGADSGESWNRREPSPPAAPSQGLYLGGVGPAQPSPQTPATAEQPPSAPAEGKP